MKTTGARGIPPLVHRRVPRLCSGRGQTLTLLIMAALFAAACASLGARDPIATLSVLTVTNQRTEPATIYLMRDGHRHRRLGEIGGLKSQAFMLNDDDVATTLGLQFLAVFPISGLTEISDNVLAVHGVTYAWKLVPGEGQQSLSFSYW